MPSPQVWERFGARILTDQYNHRIVDAWGDNVVKFIEDFVNTPTTTDGIHGWTTNLVEAGSGESTVTLDDASGGVLLLTTDNADNDGINMQRAPESFRVDNNSFYFGVRFKMAENTQSDFFLGLSVTDTAILTNLGKRIGFRKVDGEAIVAFESEKTNTTQVTSIKSMVNDTWTHLECVYDKDAGKLWYYVDGVEKGPIGITDLPDTELKPSIHFLAGSAAINTMRIDWMRCFQFGRN